MLTKCCVDVGVLLHKSMIQTIYREAYTDALVINLINIRMKIRHLKLFTWQVILTVRTSWALTRYQVDARILKTWWYLLFYSSDFQTFCAKGTPESNARSQGTPVFLGRVPGVQVEEKSKVLINLWYVTHYYFPHQYLCRHLGFA